MKYIHTSIKQHQDINLEKVIKIAKQNNASSQVGSFAIIFYEVRGNGITWGFKTAEERDEALENIRAASGSTNISEMVKL